MFVRLTKVQVETDKIEVFSKLYRRFVIPAAQRQKGYKGDLMLTDRKTGKCISITLRESEQDAIANEISDYYQQHVGRSKDYFTKPPVKENYEVSLQV